MITIDRLFHIDLTHAWNRSASRFDPISEERFAALFSAPCQQREASLQALIKDRCLFPKDAEYVADVVRRHASSALFITLITNSEDEFGEPELGQARKDLPLTPSSIEEVRALILTRLACGIPVLAEVEIFLDGPHID